MSYAVVFPKPVTCGYCSEHAELVDKSEVLSQGAEGRVWFCRPCDAWVGAHKEFPYKPVGTLANMRLRAKRLQAHCLFDQLWRSVSMRKGWTSDKARRAGYYWLAEQMGIASEECNISAFDEVKTQVAIDICRAALACREAA